MLSVILCDKFDDLEKMDDIFSSNQVKIICSSPVMADAYRRLCFNKEQHSKKVAIITIFEFLKESLSRGYNNDFLDKITNKADLILNLAILWKKYYPNQSLEKFMNAFNLLTEFRGCTQNLDLLEDIFKEYDEITSRSIKMFWMLMEEIGLIDEHRCYSLLAEAYRINEHPIIKGRSDCGFETLIFWGFSHMSSMQIDMLNALSIKHNVYVPFPESVYNDSIYGDWVNWLEPDKIKRYSKKNLDKNSAKIIKFPKGKMGEYLHNAFKKNILENKYTITLAEKNPSLDQINEIPFDECVFKTKNDIFADDVSHLLEEIIGGCFQKDKEIKTDVAVEYLIKISKSFIQKEKYRKLKVTILFINTIKKWQNLSEINSVLVVFDLKVIASVVKLNLPRTFSIPLINNKMSNRIQGIENIMTLDLKRVNIICATSKYFPLKSSEERYESSVMDFMSAIGPVMRNEFEFLILKHAVKTVLEYSDSYLIIEDSMENEDICWNRILEEVNTNELDIDISNKKRLKEDVFENYVLDLSKHTYKRISVSKMQNYIDCPRKYYFTNIDNVKTGKELETFISSNYLGMMEHDIINIYVNNFDRINMKEHQKIVKNVFSTYQNKYKWRLDYPRETKTYQEITNYSLNGIEKLFLIKNEFADVEFLFEESFEHKIDNITYNGRVDCIVKTSLGYGIIDFKRSESSIPSMDNLRDYSKIQLSFYLNHFSKEEEKDWIFAGYLCLSAVDKSNFVYFDEAIFEILLGCELIKKRTMKNKFLEYKKYIGDYKNIEEKCINSLKSEKTFLPSPLNLSVCKWCVVKNLCKKTSSIF